MKKIFFLGTPNIAVPTLEAINQLEDYEIVGVGVFPDKKVGRKQILTPCPVKAKAVELNLPVIEIKTKAELIEVFSTLKFDLAIVIAFGMIFPKEIFALRDKSNWDIVNIHFSLLPQYRGASPVQSAILNGEKKSGITWQKMVHELDEGDLLAEKHYEIEGKSTRQLWELFAEESAGSSQTFLKLYFAGQLVPLPQQNLIDQNKRAVSTCGMFEKSDGIIDPQRESAQSIYQKYLAFDVWPGVVLQKKGEPDLKLKKITLQETPQSLKVKCKDNTFIYVLEAQIPGKRAMKIAELLRGFPDLYSDEKTKQHSITEFHSQQ